MTDVYTDLRMIYEKLGVRACPYCGKIICAADCREETEKIGSDFRVYMYCSECGERMDKLTRTDFSFNTKEGACPACEGLGRIHTIKRDEMIDETLPLEAGAVRYWEKNYGEYQISIFQKALNYYEIPIRPQTPVAQYSELQKAILYDGVLCSAVKDAFPDRQPPKTAAAGKFEGVAPILWRRYMDRQGELTQFERFFEQAVCPECQGKRLAELSRSVTVNGMRLPQLSAFSLEEMLEWICELRESLSKEHIREVLNMSVEEACVFFDGEKKIREILQLLMDVGLGYLELGQTLTTLSGGECQRLKLAKELIGCPAGQKNLYLLDEPTVGLHPKDIVHFQRLIDRLTDAGNTVIVVEHNQQLIGQCDWAIDLGPEGGAKGGQLMYAGQPRRS